MKFLSVARSAATLTAIAASLAMAAPAAASNAHAIPATDEGASSVVYAAAPGEDNRLTVNVDDETVVFEDTGATISPGAGCVASSPQRVVCTLDTSHTTGLAVTLGDRDDTAQLLGNAFGRTDGGPGADVITGGPGGGSIYGGPDDDRIEGGESGSYLNGGTGRDMIAGGDDEEDCRTTHGECDYLAGGDAPGQPERDVFTGAGKDIVDYEGRQEQITVDLAKGVGGAQGEGDEINGLHGVHGGSNDDTLRGTSGADYLVGRRGDDRIRARAGADLVKGHAGADAVDGGADRDRLRGGAGDDRFLNGRDRAVDRNLCGSGADSVIGQDIRDFVDGDDCETAGWASSRSAPEFGTITVSPKWPGSDGSVMAYRGTCIDNRCRGTVRLFSRGQAFPRDPRPDGRLRLVGSGRFDFRGAGGRSGSMQVKLNKLGRKLRSRGAYFQARIIASDGSRWGFTTHLWGPTDG
jgi:Ca2+-binding RTX toxin-like protein